jgi:NTP pyrophosphatase (non-canonical NTP hydrolase)
MDTFSQLQLINLALERIFPDGNDPYQIMTRLLEECGELAEQVHIFEDSGVKRQKHGAPDPAKMVKEIQDVIGCALQVATHYGLVTTLHEAIEQRFHVYQEKGHITEQDLNQLQL